MTPPHHFSFFTCPTDYIKHYLQTNPWIVELYKEKKTPLWAFSGVNWAYNNYLKYNGKAGCMQLQSIYVENTPFVARLRMDVFGTVDMLTEDFMDEIKAQIRGISAEHAPILAGGAASSAAARAAPSVAGAGAGRGAGRGVGARGGRASSAAGAGGGGSRRGNARKAAPPSGAAKSAAAAGAAIDTTQEDDEEYEVGIGLGAVPRRFTPERVAWEKRKREEEGAVAVAVNDGDSDSSSEAQWEPVA